jgi:hypothetical protein
MQQLVPQAIMQQQSYDWRWFPLALSVIFACSLLTNLSIELFFKRRVGYMHARLGLLHLCLLVVGFVEATSDSSPSLRLLYHIALGASGCALTYTAAEEFQHKNVSNAASGTLDQHATVTYGEMREHLFYQVRTEEQRVYCNIVLISRDGRCFNS